MDRVSLARCDTYDRDGIREALNALLSPLGGMSAFASPGERVLIKPNMLAAKPPEAVVTTHPSLVAVVAEQLIAIGCRVMIGDSPGTGGTRKVAARCGIAGVAAEQGAGLVEFDESVELNGSGTFRCISIARAYWEADKIINLPKLKTHEMMTMTCAVKNLFGAVVGMQKAAWHMKAGRSRELFARLLLEISLLKPPTLNIVDGIVAMEGNGPASGDPVRLGALIAGANPVAVDLVAGRLAGIASDLLPLELEAGRMGLPGTEMEQIELAGAPLAAFGRHRFRLPAGLDVRFGLPPFITRRLQRHLTSRPEADAGRCVLCGVCRDSCPPEAITIQNSSLIIDHEGCIRCWCCRELCPHDAMLVRRGLLLRLYLALTRAKRAPGYASSSSAPRGISR